MHWIALAHTGTTSWRAMDGIGTSVAGAGTEKLDVTILLDCFVQWSMVVNDSSWLVFIQFQLPEKQEVLCTLKCCPLKRFHLSRRSWFCSDFGTLLAMRQPCLLAWYLQLWLLLPSKTWPYRWAFLSDSMLNKNHVDGSNQCYSKLFTVVFLESPFENPMLAKMMSCNLSVFWLDVFALRKQWNDRTAENNEMLA